MAQLRLFPIFFHDNLAPVSAQHQEAMVQGQTNRGEEVTGQIPGIDKEDDNNQ